MTDYEKALIRAKAMEIGLLHSKQRYDGQAELWQVRDMAVQVYDWLIKE